MAPMVFSTGLPWHIFAVVHKLFWCVEHFKHFSARKLKILICIWIRWPLELISRTSSGPRSRLWKSLHWCFSGGPPIFFEYDKIWEIAPFYENNLPFCIFTKLCVQCMYVLLNVTQSEISRVLSSLFGKRGAGDKYSTDLLFSILCRLSLCF